MLARLSTPLSASIIIVQHVDAAFAPGLGQWLTEQTGHRVQLAVDGHLPAIGEILLSGTDDHLVLGEDRRLHYSVEPKESSYRPSVDVFFDSAARNWPRPGVGVLLTGMLRDGAMGLLNLRRERLANDCSGRVVERCLGNAQGSRRDRSGRGSRIATENCPRHRKADARLIAHGASQTS